MPELQSESPFPIKHRCNRYYHNKRWELIQEFGAECKNCGEPDITKLQFAHKIGFRIPQGCSRGKNKRIREVLNNKDHFDLLCSKCHRKYDRDNPLTEDEKRQIKEQVPF